MSLPETTLSPRPSAERLAFFRQSSWMILATVACGMFMTAVHVVVSKPMLKSEYAVFFTLLRAFLLMGVPAAGLQIIFAQEAAAALTEEQLHRLSQTTRSVLRGTLLLWLMLAGAIFFWRHPIIALLKITNPVALWMTVLLGLISLWLPVLKGILQGRQNFAGLGWVLILDGLGRFSAIILIVQLGGQAAGGMTGAFLGQMVSLSVATWLVRGILSGPGAEFEWRPWLARVVPLTLGVGVVLFMSTADVIYVQTLFSKERSYFYTPAAMIGLALFMFTTPLAAVMFPKIVQSAARTEKSDALQHTLLGTAVLGGAAALACTIFPELPLRIIYFRSPVYWQSAPLVTGFVWALLPLIIANVLISNLLAHRRFQVVPWAVLVAIGYAAALFALRSRVVSVAEADVFSGLKLVIGTLGFFNVLLLACALWHSRRNLKEA